MIVKNVIISEEAKADIEAAKAFYGSKEIGIGDYFIDCILSDLESLSFFAGIHIKEHGYFRMLSKKFPFAIYYEVTDTLAIVVAILDMRRNPTWLNVQLDMR
ncbi:MAG: type II toxin-antitoxin system RelE/ParE family toxin [Desulfamplus sp.]|nr:type II toxin-antitoxin system RelE/ParE family toxin [Desulfamplus sp.]